MDIMDLINPAPKKRTMVDFLREEAEFNERQAAEKKRKAEAADAIDDPMDLLDLP
jgi:hypothetical protein